MNPINNPYSPGAGLRPAELVGRDREIESFDVLRARARQRRQSQSAILTGLRGVGKTVLLNELANRARDDGWIVAGIEAESAGTRTPFRSQVARELNVALRQLTGANVKGSFRERAMKTFKSFSLKASADGSLAIGIELDPNRGRADSGSLPADLVDLALDLGDAAIELDCGVALFVDEMQHLEADELSAICQACHAAGQQNKPFYVIGAGLPNLPGLLAEAQSYAERLFAYSTIGPLAPPAAADAIVKPAATEDVKWEPQAVDAILEAAAGYPYFLQEFGAAAWDAAPNGGNTIDVASAAEGVRMGLGRLDAGFFRSRWARATNAERDLMTAMAEDDGRPSQSADIAARLGKKRQSIGPARANLIAKGLVYAPEHGLIAFTVPGMAEFIRRQM